LNRLYAAITGLAILVSTAGSLYVTGHRNGRAQCQLAQSTASANAGAGRSTLETEAGLMPDPDLDRRLARWMRPD